MKALSIKQPWSWLIVNGIKDIENRTWQTNFRGWVFIHAGKVYDGGNDTHYFITNALKSLGLYDSVERPTTFDMGGIVGIAEIVDCVSESDSTWFMGDYGFVLRNARPLPFTPLRGQLGFFEVPEEITKELLKEGIYG